MVRSLLTKSSKENKVSEEKGDDGSKLRHDQYIALLFNGCMCCVCEEISLRSISIYSAMAW